MTSPYLVFARVEEGGRILSVGISKAPKARASARPGAQPAPALSETDFQRHVARELHDQVAQPLIGLVLDIRELRRRRRPAAAKDLAHIEDAARQILRQAREMLIDLRGQGEMRVNFVQALKAEVIARDAKRSTLKVSTRWPRRINGWAAFNLLRIVQQAVANAQRHGRANAIDISLDLGADGEPRLVVLDDGVGIDAAQRGYGMVGMQERAEILGGTFTAQPRDSGGTRIEVRLPKENLA